ITSIGLDHQNVLGDTEVEIAREKAGIIKENKPVVLGNIDLPARTEIEKTAHQNNSSILRAGELEPEWQSGKVTLKNGKLQILTKFREEINKWNIACAWLVITSLQDRFPVNEQVILKALESFNGVAARFEKLHPDYEWYFSGSHNIQALKSSLEAVQELKPKSDVVLVFSGMKDKLNAEILGHYSGFKRILFVEQEGERATKFMDINKKVKAELMDESSKEIIFNELKTELVIFMGSFYFYPTVKRWIGNVS
ncbi:MAG: cyanophycin synthetase, partial [Gracilimonas sp.]